MRARAADKKQRTWSEEFRSFRAEFLYSQNEMAGLLGISKRTVYSIESGEVINPRTQTQRKFHALRHRFEQQRLAQETKRRAREQALKAITKGRTSAPSHLFRGETMPIGA